MFDADGGGGSSTSRPSYSGTTQTLNIEPSAIPGALAAFRVAQERVARKVSELNGVPIQPWAHDTVSRETATQFHDRTLGGGADSAIACLTGYQRQLANACDSLQQAHDAYTQMEGDNSALWGKHH